MSLGQLVVELSLDGKEFTVNLLKAEGMLANFSRKAESASSTIQRAEHHHRSFGRTIRDTVITLGLMESALHMVGSAAFGWQKSIISVNSEVQRSIQLMKSFSTSTDSIVATRDAIADVQSMLDKASNAPFGLQALTDSFVKLRVAGIEDARGALDTLTDSVAAFGGSDENLKRASVAIQQMSGKGVISMEELRQQLGEAVPSAISAMADGLGVGYDKLVKQISLGRVKAGPAIQAMMDELDRRFRGKAEVMMDTWSGAVSQFETSVKRMALAVGGLEADGYAKDGYMKALTEELQRLTETLNDPQMANSAREFGRTLAQIVRAAGEGIHWIIANREELYKWGQMILTVWAAARGFSILHSMATGIAGVTATLVSLRGAGGQLKDVMGNLSAAMASQAQVAARAIGPMQQGQVAMTRWGHAGAALTGALGMLGGPLGMITTMAAAGAVSWLQYRDSVEDARQKVLDLKGALTDVAQLRIVAEEQSRIEGSIKYNKSKLSAIQNSIYASEDDRNGTSERTKELIDQIAKEETQYREIAKDLIAGRITLADQYGSEIARKSITAINKSFEGISNSYNVAVNKLKAEMDKAPEGFKQDKYNEGVDKLRAEADQKTVDLIQSKIKEAEGVRESMLQAGKRVSDKASIEAKAEYVANEEVIRQLNQMLADQHAKMTAAKITMTDTKLDGAAGPGEGGKPKFDPFSKFMDGLAVKVAKADAVIEQANPHMAEMQQILENMAADGLARPAQAEIDAAMRLAAARWEQEKSIKALKQANTDYQDSADRITQIDRVMTAKLSKVENENPWLKASADAVRYQEELDDLTVKLEQARKAASENAKANPVDAQRIQQDITATEAKIESLKGKIDLLSTTAAGKAMTERVKEIRDGLATERELIDQQYEYDLAKAQEYHEELKASLGNNAAAYAAYKDYLKALEDKYARDTESGLQEWIRENRDAADEYKSLWKSAMDSFNDMIVDGLMEGKFEIAQFAEFVAKEMLKIQVAKATAGIASSFSDGLTGMIGNAIGGFIGGGGAATAGSSIADYSSVDLSNFSPKASEFATGGIMTEYGKASLKKYANGGIANSPQIALYGEGSKPEAYVPLPDGRTIPVTLSGIGGGGGGSSNVNVNVNVVEGQGTKATVKQSPDGQGGMNIDIIVEQIEGKMSQNIAKGRSSVGQVLERTYGLNRAAGAVR